MATIEERIQRLRQSGAAGSAGTPSQSKSGLTISERLERMRQSGSRANAASTQQERKQTQAQPKAQARAASPLSSPASSLQTAAQRAGSQTFNMVREQAEKQPSTQTSRTDRRAQLESDLAKVNQEQRLLAARTNLARRSRGFTTEDREAAEAEAAPLRREAEDLRHGVEGIDYQDKYDAITRRDDFGGQFLASYDVGSLGEKESMAWYEYLSNPTEGNRAYAEAISAALQDYILRNQAALDEDATLPIVSQSLARQLPQFINQQKYGIGGALVGAAAGSVLPVAGTAAGAKIGYTGGRALYGYETARGAAFKTLLDAGVDEETARAASNDEAIINSVIEGGDAVLDMLALGIGRGISAILGQPVKAAATTAGRKALAALGKYGINVASEGAQEWVQEGVSAANEGRTDTGLLNLISESAGQIGRAVTGQDPEALARMNEAGLEGIRVAAIMGAAGMAGNAAVNRVLRRPATQQQSQEDGLSQEAEAQAQTDSGIPEATRRAVEMLAQGEEISGNQAARIAENEEAMALLSQLTGEEIDTDAPISRVKRDIRALASRQERLSGEAGVNSQATQSGAQTSLLNGERQTDADVLRNISQVRRAASALGENGSRAMTAAYDETMARQYAPEQIVEGFYRIYNAAMEGRELPRVSIPEQVRMAAESSAQLDRTRAEQARYFGESAGLRRDAAQRRANLSSQDARRLDALGKALGVEIRFAETVDDGAGRQANARYGDGTITLSLNADDPVFTSVIHEAVHRIRETDPDSYTMLADFVQSNMSDEDLGHAIGSRSALYGTNAVDFLTEETVADAFGRMVNKESLDRLARDDRGVVRKVLDVVRDIIAKIRRALTGKEVTLTDSQRAEFRELAGRMGEMERLFAEALERTEPLRGGHADGTMGETRYSLKEDQDYGRRKETRTGFLRRAAGEGYAVYEGETVAYGYRGPVQLGHESGAGQVREELQNLGITGIITDGSVLWNRNDITRARQVKQAAAANGEVIFISENVSIPAKRVAGHEAFHFWKNGTGRDAYIDTIEDNLLFTSEAFREYQSTIAEAYLGGEADLSNDAQMGKLREELFAYISGDIHEGTNDEALRPIFRDFDAVRAAWEHLVEENSAEGTRISLKPTDSQGRELTQEQQEFFRDSKITDAEGRLLVLYHGTTTYGEITKFRRGRSGWLGPGIYLASRRSDAQRYADAMGEGNGQLYELYANVINPLVVTEGNPVPEILRAAYGRDSIYKSRSAKQGNDAQIITTADIKKLQSKGYDGIRWDFGGSTEVSVFSPEQIKRVDNLTPSGSQDVRYSLSNREQLEEYIREYGPIPQGERPYREVRLPRRTSETERLSQTVRTILEGRATPEAAIPSIEALAADGTLSYEPYTDRQAMADAEAAITDESYKTALNNWTNNVREGKVSKRLTAEGWAIYNQAANSGDIETAMTVLTDMVEHQRNAAQALQATRIFKKLSPDAQLYGVARSVRNLTEELLDKYGDKAPELRIDEELAARFLAAKTDRERDLAMQELYRDIGRQMPSRFVDKWNAWRYLAMLGNPRTHVRNIVGNAFYTPVVAAKDLTATAIEAAVSRVSGGKLARTKALVGPRDRALLSAAWGDYGNAEERIMGGGKYSETASANRHIQEGRVIFKNPLLERARRENSRLLDLEDAWFSKPHYAYALSQYAKANGITAEQIRSGKGLDEARAYAVREAQKATYRDTNAFSEMISDLGRYRGKNPAKRAASVALEGILPFRKTPANILVRGVEYSPLGLLKSLGYDLVQVGRGKLDAATAIDNISAGLTGTGLMALGIFLAAEGLVRGAGEGDDKEREFDELRGHQAYSLEVGGQSYTLDWLAPEALPFFVGVNLWEQTQAESEDVTLSAMLQAAGNVTEPLLEMSCLQSLNAAFDAVGYASEAELGPLATTLASAATSYLTQAIPSLLGQFERTGQDIRMTTYTERDAFLTPDMQYTLGRASSRIPGWDYQQIPYIDAWGRTEATGPAWARAADNFLNPAYRSAIETSPMEDELERLYAQTGEAGVLPKRAERSFKVDGEQKYLTAEEYVKFAREQGQTSYHILTELTAGASYQAASDAGKAEMVEMAYEYARATAKAAVSGYQLDGWVEKARKAERSGVPVSRYIPLYVQQKGVESIKGADGEPIDNSRGLLVMEDVYGVKGLTDKQRQQLFEDFGVGKSVQHYNQALVKEKLEQMRRKGK